MSNGKRQFNDLVMERKEEPMKCFPRVETIVVLGALGLHLPVEDVNPSIAEMLTADYKIEQRTIL